MTIRFGMLGLSVNAIMNTNNCGKVYRRRARRKGSRRGSATTRHDPTIRARVQRTYVHCLFTLCGGVYGKCKSLRRPILLNRGRAGIVLRFMGEYSC